MTEQQNLPVTGTAPRSLQNVQKRDTLFTQERASVVNAVKRRPHQAVARAVKGAQKLVADDQAKQALNVLTLAKDLVEKAAPADATDYYLALASIHQHMGSIAPAQRALTQAQEHLQAQDVPTNSQKSALEKLADSLSV
ncbi:MULTISPECIES: hypothetical protein [unclassified Rothia (in: high G+C Gram-positive bacteria)]|uniref:hypothetical protein n=1 Tax=unclassified Rothia (in: high G+C Gram-positive bacteria) TaxID=2689056 RepID=UPI00195AB650|nr:MULTISPECIES: hypothetical protein [unclassified Rothia (in: high G+C Gram-positive bacteria)]MBM7050675.1 hypothetical protein [Rothia sp. ZJ1223]QRZ60863.1 hypothetical protein JR346_06150 [Rothia sp. ZJ932]